MASPIPADQKAPGNGRKVPGWPAYCPTSISSRNGGKVKLFGVRRMANGERSRCKSEGWNRGPSASLWAGWRWLWLGGLRDRGTGVAQELEVDEGDHACDH